MVLEMMLACIIFRCHHHNALDEVCFCLLLDDHHECTDDGQDCSHHSYGADCFIAWTYSDRTSASHISDPIILALPPSMLATGMAKRAECVDLCYAFESMPPASPPNLESVPRRGPPALQAMSI